MKRYLHAALTAALIIMLAPVFALAADTAPETVAQATSDTTKIVWGWDSAATAVAQVLAYLIGGIAARALRKLPANAQHGRRLLAAARSVPRVREVTG